VNQFLITPIDPSNGLPTIGPHQNPVTIYSNPTHMPATTVYLYSTQMQYSLPKDWVMTIGYQGSAGHHLTRLKNLRYFYPNGNPDVNNFFTPTPDTNSSFNALNTELEHRFYGGVSFNMLYTYSKSIDQMSSEGPGFSTNQTYPINDHTERGPSDYDATHNFRMFGVWELPVFRARNDFVGKLAGGWQLNGIYQFHSGFPWTPVAYNYCPALGSVCLNPIRPIAYNGAAGHNAENSAFLPPTSGNFPALAGIGQNPNPYFTLQTSGSFPEFPGIGRNTFRGPRFQDIDLSVAKQFGLPTMKFVGEGAKIELRLGAYNVFNKLNLAPFTFGSTSTTISSNNNNAGQPVANPLFGTATNGLAGRVLELQARFSF
jgi:hypothetical protein